MPGMDAPCDVPGCPEPMVCTAYPGDPMWQMKLCAVHESLGPITRAEAARWMLPPEHPNCRGTVEPA